MGVAKQQMKRQHRAAKRRLIRELKRAGATYHQIGLTIVRARRERSLFASELR